jgi:pyruvate formate lyase activating enzyme
MLDVPRTPHATLSRARDIALANGVRHAYTGNVRDAEGAATRCTGCGTVVIGRDGYDLTAYRIDGRGACTACGTRLAGRFDGAAGTWGNRRLPVRVTDFAEEAS